MSLVRAFGLFKDTFGHSFRFMTQNTSLDSFIQYIDRGAKLGLTESTEECDPTPRWFYDCPSSNAQISLDTCNDLATVTDTVLNTITKIFNEYVYSIFCPKPSEPTEPMEPLDINVILIGAGLLLGGLACAAGMVYCRKAKPAKQEDYQDLGTASIIRMP